MASQGQQVSSEVVPHGRGPAGPAECSTLGAHRLRGPQCQGESFPMMCCPCKPRSCSVNPVSGLWAVSAHPMAVLEAEGVGVATPCEEEAEERAVWSGGGFLSVFLVLALVEGCSLGSPCCCFSEKHPIRKDLSATWLGRKGKGRESFSL